MLVFVVVQALMLSKYVEDKRGGGHYRLTIVSAAFSGRSIM